ncbi:MAG TPA: GNAT family N-acetyltransferase [Anaerolineaceae bacterium]|jgi:hypothetical protein
MKPHLVVNHPEKQRFEAQVEGELAYLEYDLQGSQLTLIHTEVPETLAGQGVGSALAQTALETARANQLKVVPLCPFVRNYLGHHPEYQDVLAGG